MKKILSLLEKDATLTAKQIAVMLGMQEEEVADIIKKHEENKTILGYKAIVDWDNANGDFVSAMIELKVTPKLGEGFDMVADQIKQYDEVTSVFLMSGGFDIWVLVEGKTMKEVALFVAEKLAPMEPVLSTATHFVLKKYKVDGVLTKDDNQDPREVISL